MSIDLPGYPSLKTNLLPAPESWSEGDAPLAWRGVRVSWLIGLVRDLLADINRQREAAIALAVHASQHNKAGAHGLHERPDMDVPDVPAHALLNVHALVDHVVRPVTTAGRSPLWPFVPLEHRGRPDYFLSHTWSSLLLGPPDQAIGTLDAIEHAGGFAWIDFVAYNQHAIRSIPQEMESVIGTIGKVIFAGTPVPTLNRIWCLWELLCASRTGTEFDIAVRRGYRNDKILAVNTLYRSFVGVEHSRATRPEDLEIIRAEVIAQFGSPAVADSYLERVLLDRFSAPFYELRPRDQHLGFRPWPWLAEQTESGRELADQRVRESEPYYGPGLRNTVIHGSGQATFGMLIDAGLMVSAKDKARHQIRSSSEVDQQLVLAAQSGDLTAVQRWLARGSNPDRPIGNASALAHAARAGHASVIEWLLDHGADIEGGGGLSPLACAAWMGQDDVVQLLLKRRANIEGDTGGAGTALFQAASQGHLSTVRLLLEQGATVNAKTDRKATPLLVAAAAGHADIVATLVEAGADLECTDRSGDTALHHAAHKGWVPILKTLVEAGANRATTDKYGNTPFDMARREGRLEAAMLDILRP